MFKEMFKRLRRLFSIRAMLVIVMLFVLAVPVWATNGDDWNVGGLALALAIAGLIAPWLTQLLKKLFGDVEGLAALWATFVVAILVSLVALIITGELGWTAPPSDPVAWGTWFLQFVGGVFTMATLIYKHFISRPE